MSKIDRQRQIDSAFRRSFFSDISPVLKYCFPLLFFLVAIWAFLQFDQPVYTGRDIEGVVVERLRSAQGYRPTYSVEVLKIQLSNGVVQFDEKPNLQIGDKVLYEVYKSRYSGGEVYKPKPSAFIPMKGG